MNTELIIGKRYFAIRKAASKERRFRKLKFGYQDQYGTAYTFFGVRVEIGKQRN